MLMSEYSSTACSMPVRMELQYSPGLTAGVLTMIRKVLRHAIAEAWRSHR